MQGRKDSLTQTGYQEGEPGMEHTPCKATVGRLCPSSRMRDGEPRRSTRGCGSHQSQSCHHPRSPPRLHTSPTNGGRDTSTAAGWKIDGQGAPQMASPCGKTPVSSPQAFLEDLRQPLKPGGS